MSGPKIFYVTEAVGPLVPTPVVKQSIDITEVIVDFSKWLNSDETISQLSAFAIQANPSSSYPSWQTDFPFVTPSSPAPADTNPLVMFAVVLLTPTRASISIGNGTPGLAYIFSFLVTSTPRQRTKEVDLLVSVNPAVNSAMISSITLPTMAVTVVTGNATLAVGTNGSVNISNNTGTPITITLPATPVTDQALTFKDVLGNAQTNYITLAGAGGALIDGAANLFMAQNYESVTIKWTGSQWSVV